ncbi:MAG: DUF2207 domain-containing protein [candidate division KSB1 bacterium]|jgi:uncharacterized membrane protein|nr:DUF2207 domain-containing protein [candidate division KSB1 bacterium]
MMNKILTFLLAILLLLITQSDIFAKSYSIDHIQIDAEILDDGSLQIEERRTYNFRRDKFSWADYKLPLSDLGRVVNFSLSEGNESYTLSEEKVKGTYYTRQNDDRFYVKWYYSASNEERTFTLRYRVEDAVTVYDDVAVLYYKFVGEKRRKNVAAVDVKLHFPQPADTVNVRAWAHGPLNGTLTFESAGFISMAVRPLSKKNYWEIRTLFPKDWVAQASNVMAGSVKGRILQEEKEWAEKANVLREKAAREEAMQQQNDRRALYYASLLVIIGLMLFFYFYQRYGRSHPIRHQGQIMSEIPEGLPPAIANYVFTSGQTNANALVSTLLDLARRGFITIDEKQEQNKFLFWNYKSASYTVRLMKETFESQKSQLSAYELDMLDFIFGDLAEGYNDIDMKKLSQSRSKFVKWFARWKKIIKNSWGNRPLYDKSSVRGTTISAILSGLIIVAGILMMIFWGMFGLIAILGGCVLLVISFFILRYTKDVKSMIERLKGLKKYLVKYHFRNQPGQLQSNLENYLIYGIALGAGTKVIKEIIATVPDWQSAGIIPWYSSTAAHTSPDAFATAVSSMISTVGSTMSSASGAGGGASAGGGGGAGGAAGGAG